MNIDRIAMLFLSVLLVSPVSTAQTIYESTGEDGVKEFSDAPSSGATEVEVNPNVVDTPATPKFEPAPEPVKQEPAKAAAPTSIEVTVEDDDDDDDFHRWNRREHRRR